MSAFCNRCYASSWAPCKAGRPVYYCCGNGLEGEGEGEGEGETFLQNLKMKIDAEIQSLSSLNPSFSRPEGLVPEDESLPVAARTMMRGNMGKRLLGPIAEQYLQKSVESQAGRRRTPLALGASVQSLVEQVKVRGKDVAVHCAKCKGEFEIGEYANRMSCNHMYHTECIVEWFGQNNFCLACRDKRSADDLEYARMHSSGRDDTSSSAAIGISRVRFDSHRPFSPALEPLLQEYVESGPSRRGLPPASSAFVDSLKVALRDKDVALQCWMCKGEFVKGTYSKRMPCGHFYHDDCIREWLTQHNSCRACRYKISTDNSEYDHPHSRVRNGTSFSGGRSRVSHISPFRASMTTFQQAQAETSSGPASNGKSVSSSFHYTQGNNLDLDDDGDVIMQDALQ